MRSLIWVGSSRSDLQKFSEELKKSFGYALYIAQKGERYLHSKILKGFGGAGIIEIIQRDKSGTFRVVYTVKMPKVVFVLHAFQKKSKQGIKTPKREVDLIRQRLREALEIYKELNEKEI